jgi:hypothetical protein
VFFIVDRVKWLGIGRCTILDDNKRGYSPISKNGGGGARKRLMESGWPVFVYYYYYYYYYYALWTMVLSEGKLEKMHLSILKGELLPLGSMLDAFVIPEVDHSQSSHALLH